MPTVINGIGVNNLRKNLQIRSMVYNFIIIIYIIEFVSNIVLETNLLIKSTIGSEDYWINLFTCRVEDFPKDSKNTLYLLF